MWNNTFNLDQECTCTCMYLCIVSYSIAIWCNSHWGGLLLSMFYCFVVCKKEWAYQWEHTVLRTGRQNSSKDFTGKFILFLWYAGARQTLFFSYMWCMYVQLACEDQFEFNSSFRKELKDLEMMETPSIGVDSDGRRHWLLKVSEDFISLSLSLSLSNSLCLYLSCIYTHNDIAHICTCTVTYHIHTVLFIIIIHSILISFL